MSPLTRPQPCENLNHRRASAPVRHCAGCGGIVNQLVDARRCTEAGHAAMRKQRSAFCVDCGAQLVFIR
jgi:hypothetical protein